MNKAITDIRGEDSAELNAKLSDLRKEQFNLRFRGSTESGAKTTRSREVKRTIARILMVLGDRARSGDQKPGDHKPGEHKPIAKATVAKATVAKQPGDKKVKKTVAKQAGDKKP